MQGHNELPSGHPDEQEEIFGPQNAQDQVRLGQVRLDQIRLGELPKIRAVMGLSAIPAIKKGLCYIDDEPNLN